MHRGSEPRQREEELEALDRSWGLASNPLHWTPRGSDQALEGSHLPLGEPQRGGQLGFPPDGDVATVVKLLLQLQTLVVRVHDSVFVFRPGFHCGGRRS